MYDISAVNDISVLFFLLSFANQQFEAAYGYGAVDLHREEDEALKKYDAAVLVISDILTNGNVKEAEELIRAYGKSVNIKFPSLDGKESNQPDADVEDDGFLS